MGLAGSLIPDSQCAAVHLGKGSSLPLSPQPQPAAQVGPGPLGLPPSCQEGADSAEASSRED